jgi:protein-L-isoaspartate(D-aspartate) O-methyltransferase
LGQRISKMNKSINLLLQRYVSDLDSIVSDRVRHAFLNVERHRFLEGFYRREQDGTRVWQPLDLLAPDPNILEYIYADNSLVISLSPWSSSTQPWLMARMLELLELKEGMRVLEVGAGTGYNAALLAEIVGADGQVTTIEIHPEIAARTRRLLDAAGYSQVRLQIGDGYFGWAEDAPYDRIVATTACADLAPCWFEQLQPDGCMLIPLRHSGPYTAPLTLVKRDGQAKVIEYSGFGKAQGQIGALGLWPDLSEDEIAARLNEPGVVEKAHLTFKEREWQELCFDLHYFVALNDPRTYDGPSRTAGLGLWESPGSIAALFPSGMVKLHGNEALYERLARLYDEYVALGQPRMQGYQIHFVRQARPVSVQLRRLGSREWVIHKFFTRVKAWYPSLQN